METQKEKVNILKQTFRKQIKVKTRKGLLKPIEIFLFSPNLVIS